jgi:Ca2+-dependent lipid-binding protein
MAAQYQLPSSGAKLEVHLIAGRHLKAADVNGKSDPYVVLKCGDAEVKSHTKNNTLTPEWNERIVLELKNSKPEYLEIIVLDHDAVGKDDPLGALVLPLNDLIQSLEKQRWIKLQGVDTGEIYVGLTAVNFGYPAGTFTGYDPKTLDIAYHIPPAYAPKGYLIENGCLVRKPKKHK